MICSCKAQTWLCKLGFVYKKVCKNVFVDKHKWPDIKENRNLFLTWIEELKLYIIEFNKNSIIKAKKYPINYIVKDD